MFSAGLDLDHHFAMFARRNIKEIDDWFAAYRATNLRLFTYPRPDGRLKRGQLRLFSSWATFAEMVSIARERIAVISDAHAAVTRPSTSRACL